jgi:hypothetical protein
MDLTVQRDMDDMNDEEIKEYISACNDAGIPASKQRENCKGLTYYKQRKILGKSCYKPVETDKRKKAVVTSDSENEMEVLETENTGLKREVAKLEQALANSRAKNAALLDTIRQLAAQKP